MPALSLIHIYTYLLELWHGPTCAFKDMALQLLPHLLTISAKKTVPGKEIVVLVATSGDTGKAALEGFRDVPGTKMLVFYPVHGVSNMQKLQMTTQEGKNVAVCAIEGNFDDAQSGVKRIFTDPAVLEDVYKRQAKNGTAAPIPSEQIIYNQAILDGILKSAELGREVEIEIPEI